MYMQTYASPFCYMQQCQGMCSAGTCPDGYSLSTLQSFRLKPAMEAVFKWLWQLSQGTPDSGLPLLLEQCDRDPWSRIRELWHQERNLRNRKLLLKDAFMHAVLQQLDLLCWQAAEEPAKVFLQKRQVGTSDAQLPSMLCCIQSNANRGDICEMIAPAYLQIQSIVAQALEAHNPQLAENPLLAQANELLDLYTKV